ncbi:hypothetical protein MG290_14150 [Flavobacterium sp. CBA20B-1]|uniref:hypothetical protein n=1 Tax=unclassified Flavobacterium TaxID=196869 RepID=UPI002225056C|nr:MULTISPECIES: hypothetical protein [unclassified Flavobacterium]WCM42056.1 hypothetical protein MG290_14150 [Flavobacterium sp. CBA20B-1]
MEKLSDLTKAVETKLNKLVQHLEKVVKENEALKSELLQQQTQQNDLQQKHIELQQKYDQLKIANSLLGSEDFKKETKLKINSLVREIDHCISQLTHTTD